MTKLIIFDLDGVLMDSRELHYEALNAVLASYDTKYVISLEEHLSTFDGLPTKKKLEMLSVRKGLPQGLYGDIWKFKQIKTIELLNFKLQESRKLKTLFSNLKRKGLQIAVASNAVRQTVKISVLRLGLMEYVDFLFSNEDVKNPKPNPEMYLRCMILANCCPAETVIVEDSHVGRQGAISSGAHLMPVENPDDLTEDKIMNFINDLNAKTTSTSIPWRDKNLNVLIPMAGAGSRFEKAGYTFPKPLIEIHGKPMIQVVVENLNMEANFIFLVKKEHYEQYNLKYLLNLIAPKCKIIQVERLTEGAACTTLLAKRLIDNDDHLLLVNSDQYIEWNSNECMYAFSAGDIDAGILTFESSHPKWSYVRTGDNGFVTEVAEKKVISNNASVGIYYWKRGRDYVRYAEQMIEKNIRVNNEFYVCPVFNEAIQNGKKIRVKKIDKMWGLGTPEDLAYFLANHKC